MSTQDQIDNLAIKVILTELDTDSTICDGCEHGNSLAGSTLSMGMLIHGNRWPRQRAESIARAALAQWQAEA